MANETSITRNVTGKKLASLDDPRATIDYTEYPASFTMAQGGGPYGLPIDAPLAVAMIRALREKLAKQPEDNDLRRLLENSVAITLDKSVLLKTLSQPKCEGIRFYLCLKTSDKGEEMLSLVTVGVDAEGKDLLYEFTEGTKMQEIQTRSLIAEYGHPPRIMAQASPEMDPFVLFKYSQ